MQTNEKLISVESDVNDYLNKKHSMFDNDIVEVFKKFNIRTLLNRNNIKKRCGRPTEYIIFELFLIPFLMLSNVFLFVRTQYENAVTHKNQFYRLLENANYNWFSFIQSLSFEVFKAIQEETVKNKRASDKADKKSTEFFVVDDTVHRISGKLVESASYIYDHVTGKSVLGFQKLVLGIFDGSQFLPISSHICAGKRKPKAESKAIKYKKIPKSECIPSDSPGAQERKMLSETKLEKTFSMLEQAKQKGFSASTVLFDSWFCFNSFIIKIKESLKLNVICQLKNLPRPNQYIYKGKSYSLAELWAYYAKSRLRKARKHSFKWTALRVSLAGSNVQMKIVFLQNEGKEKWHAFASTDTGLSKERILKHYSYRWSIEVFFKNCKQYLNYSKEQVSNLDSIIACDALVFMRYIILTYLAYLDNISIYKEFDKLRTTHLRRTFGMRLMDHFFKRFNELVQKVIWLLENGNINQARETLDEFVSQEEKKLEMGMV